ncbi:FecR family protein [Saccharicrinis carchari]|uniref:FecR family protein n=1 Tax=Saccharicrinis carchari TaxID=1168039 RepID=A0A521EHU3_SACCC|nr:FecR domain-containing protein [Saccharicrinis carchari]SMO83497.1 FecR family protein [Saccharicrinis carchari]
MNSNKPHIEKLIARKLSGDITAFETEELFNWIAQSGDNAQLYKNTMHTLGNTFMGGHKNIVWSKIEDKTILTLHKKPLISKVLRKKIWRIAAMLAIIALFPLALGELGEDDMGNGFVHTVRGNDITTSLYLPDNSVIILSRGSSISYNDQYAESNRELLLEGKAYIEINENESKYPMVVTSGSRCTILRSGKITINGKADGLDVAVKEGEATVVDTAYKKVVIPAFKLIPASKTNQNKVTISLLENSKVRQGQFVSYTASGNRNKSEDLDQCETFSWKDRIFCFKNLKQHELAYKMADWYGKHVEFKGQMDPYTNYSGSFDDPSVRDFIQQVFGNKVASVKESKHKITIIFS